MQVHGPDSLNQLYGNIFMKIAVLNSDTTQLKAICSIINSAGYTALAFSRSKEMVPLVQRDNVDLLILDNQVEDANVLKVITIVREKFATNFPILFLTNCFNEEETIEALAAGASDYLIKPIRRSELMTRVQVLVQGAYPNSFQPENLKLGRYLIEIRSARVSLSGHFIELTRKEFELALLLFRHVGQPLSRPTMLDAVWSRESDIPSRTLDTHISRIRNKLHLHPENGFRLVPVYSYGYCLEQTGDGDIPDITPL